MTDAGPETPGLAEWATLSESLVRGLVHALNNRLTALLAFAELDGMGDGHATPVGQRAAELERLQQVSGLLRLLVSDPTPPAAVQLDDVLADALALHAQHPDQRGARAAVVREGASQPVRVPRWALLRLLVVLLDAGRRAAERAGEGTGRLRVAGDERALTLAVEGSAPTTYARELALACGGTVEGDTVRIPSLLELRRRERAAREPG